MEAFQYIHTCRHDENNLLNLKLIGEEHLSDFECDLIVGVRGHEVTSTLVSADIKTTVTQITTCYNQGTQKTIYECATEKQKTTVGATPVIHGIIFSWNTLGSIVQSEHCSNTPAYMSMSMGVIH